MQTGNCPIIRFSHQFCKLLKNISVCIKHRFYLIAFPYKCRLYTCFILINHIVINRAGCSCQCFFRFKSRCTAFCHTDRVRSLFLHQVFCIISHPRYYNFISIFYNTRHHITIRIVRNLCDISECSGRFIKFCIINLCIFCHLLKYTGAVQLHTSGNLFLYFLPCQNQFAIDNFHVRIRICIAIIIHCLWL